MLKQKLWQTNLLATVAFVNGFSWRTKSANDTVALPRQISGIPASEIAIRALFAVPLVVLLRRLSAHFSAKDFLRMHASQNRRHRGSVERNEV